MGKELRYYQKNAINSVGVNLLEEKIDKQMIVLATGAGKTFTATQIAKKNIFNRVLWLTHTEELIEQSALAFARDYFDGDEVMQDTLDEVQEKGIIAFYDHMENNPLWAGHSLRTFKTLQEYIGIVKQKRFDINAKVVVASVQTLHRRLDKIDPKQFDLIVADECHLFGAKTFVKCLDHFEPKLRLGLTATPKRSDNFGLGNIFDTIAYEYPIVKGIDDNYLCEIEAIQVQTQLSLDDVRTTAGELNQKDLRVIDCAPRNNLIVRKYEEYAEGRQTIIFCVDVEHVKNLTEAFEERGHSVDFVVGDKELCPNRQERIQKFKDGKTKIMINCMILTAGFDHPDTSCIIMACPTKSETKFFQCVGRGTRLKSDGSNLMLLDVVDSTSRHHLVNSYELDYGKRLEDRAFMTKQRKLDLIEKRDSKIHGALKGKDEKVDLKRIPTVEINPFSYVMKQPATMKQLEWLSNLGYDIVNQTYTKGMASQLIGGQPATEKQKNALKKWRYEVPDSLTRAQAEAAFAEIKEKHGESDKSKQYKAERNAAIQRNILGEENSNQLNL